MALVIIKIEKEASTYRDNEEQDNERVLRYKRMGHEFTKLKVWEESENHFIQGIQRRADGSHF